jgi:hypothetical protein
MIILRMFMSDTDIAKLNPFEKWVKVIKELGFPIVVAGILLWSHFTVMAKLTDVMGRNVAALERVEKFLIKSEK